MRKGTRPASSTMMLDAALTTIMLRSLSLNTSAVASLSTLLHFSHCTMKGWGLVLPMLCFLTFRGMYRSDCFPSKNYIYIFIFWHPTPDEYRSRRSSSERAVTGQMNDCDPHRTVPTSREVLGANPRVPWSRSPQTMTSDLFSGRTVYVTRPTFPRFFFCRNF